MAKYGGVMEFLYFRTFKLKGVVKMWFQHANTIVYIPKTYEHY